MLPTPLLTVFKFPQTDKLRAIFEKATGKKVPAKVSN
jgi:hypothetical protein